MSIYHVLEPLFVAIIVAISALWLLQMLAPGAFAKLLGRRAPVRTGGGGCGGSGGCASCRGCGIARAMPGGEEKSVDYES